MRTLCALAALALLSGPAFATCPYPAAPAKLPDGRLATLQEMVDAHKVVKDYDAAITAYVACLDAESNDAIAKGGDQMTDKEKQEIKRIANTKHDAAITQAEEIASRFNEQVRIFKAKDKDGKKS